MCNACAMRANPLLRNSTSDVDPSVHFSASTALLDGATAAKVLPSITTAVLVVTPDDAGDGINVAPGNPTVTVDGGSIVGTIGTNGDQDYFQVRLVAGQSYEIGQYTKVGGPSGVALADAYLELYDSTGKKVAEADGGGPNTPSGLDALLSFTATTSGVYYINARAFDQDGTNGTTGDGVGDYDLFVRTVASGQPGYKPFYDPDSPLHALDWGSEFRRSSRNPDGDNGTRTDNGVTQADNLTDFRTGIQGKNVITYYFAKQGEAYVSEDPTTPGLTADMVQTLVITDAEKQQYRLAFQQYENVADVIYVEVQNRNEADLKILTYPGTPGPGASLLGRASPPGEESEGQMEYNAADERYNAAGLTQGGFFFTTLLHEIGHAHGIAHPHDNGGRSSIMRGAGGGTGGIGGAYGDFGLSQGVFTIMSYNDGWDLRPDGTPKPDDNADNGWVGTLSPLDIAVIQDKYGVNEEYNKGNNVYVLRDTQTTGTFYAAIWDGGGSDSIAYHGAKNIVIDLRAATLKYEEGGGGRVSYVTGINGGFTIANGVLIENAIGGSGNDTLTGNSGNNILNGGAGNDVMAGLAGNDYYVVSGADSVIEAAGGGFDTIATDSSYQLGAGNEIEMLVTTFEGGNAGINLIGNELGQTIIGNAAGNIITGGGGADVLIGLGGDDYYVADGDDLVRENAGGGFDVVATSTSYTLASGSQVEILTTTADGGTTAINLTGNEFGQTLRGNAAGNILNGGGGADVLSGFGGNDYYIVDADDIVLEGAGGGFDIVAAQGSYALANGADIEMLATANEGGTNALTLSGNGLAQTLWGNAGDNVLDGKGGSDTLRGLGGADTFAFTSGLGSGNVDRILDFETGVDRIALDDAVFGGLNLGSLGAGAFRTGTSAQDADDRIIYDPTTGALMFDADGAGGAAAIQFATLNVGLNLQATDFQVI